MSFYLPLPQRDSSRLLSLAEGLAPFGIHYVAAGLWKDEKASAFFTHSAWEEKYVGEGLGEIDPYTNLAKSGRVRLFEWATVPLKGDEIDVVNTRRKLCGIRNGFTFTNYQRGFHEIFAVGTDSKHLKIVDIINNQEALNDIIDCILQFRRLQLNFLTAHEV